MNNRLLIAALLALAGCGQGRAPQRPPLEGARIGGPFALVDQDGRTVTDRNFAGRYRLMYFGYTFCPDVCPQDMANVGAGLKLLAKSDPALAAKVVPVFVTVDPERDTPAALKDYLSNFDPRIHALTGSPEAVAAAERAYKVYAKKALGTDGDYSMDHTSVIYLMGKDGRFINAFNLEQPPAKAAAELEAYL